MADPIKSKKLKISARDSSTLKAGAQTSASDAAAVSVSGRKKGGPANALCAEEVKAVNAD